LGGLGAFFGPNPPLATGLHPGYTLSNLLNYTRIENKQRARKKTFAVYYVAVTGTEFKGSGGHVPPTFGQGWT